MRTQYTSDGYVCVFDGVKIKGQGRTYMTILRVGSKVMVSSKRGREDVIAALVISWQPDRH